MSVVRLDDLRSLASVAGRLGVAEAAGVLSGPGVLLVEPISWALEADEAAQIARHLRQIPAVTVLCAAAWPGSAQEVVDAFDVVVATAEEAEVVVAAVGAAPLGSYALVALTRVSEKLPAEAGIWAESATFSTLMGSRDYQEWLSSKPAPSQRAEPETLVLVESVVSDGGEVLRLTLNRPKVRNALNTRVRDALVATLELAELSPETAIELRGAGACFSAGGDLTEFGSVADPATAHAVRGTRHPALALSRVADRVCGYAHGRNVGAGVELLAFARRVVASPEATFRLPEVAMGLVPGAGGTWSVVQRIGRQRGNWLMLTGAEIDAPTALAWGLVDAIERVEPVEVGR